MSSTAEALKSMASQDDLEALVMIRNVIKTQMSAVDNNIIWPEGMEESSHQIESLDGTKLQVLRLLPKSVAQGNLTSNPAVVLATGGGMIAGSADIFRKLIAELAEETGVQFFLPEWRRAPENPYPAGVEDVYAALVWLQASAAQFSVAPDRIVIAGQSAGGGVAAGVSLMARDRKLTPPLAAQCLRCPMLDDRTGMDPSSPVYEKLTWTTGLNDLGWKLYLSGKDKSERNDENVSPYAAPARAKDLRGLPPTLITTAENDLFLNEDLQYAVALSKAGVKVELHVYPGVSHGFEGDFSRGEGSEVRATEARFIQRF